MSNLVWASNVREDGSIEMIEGPFRAYLIRGQTDKFAEWLLSDYEPKTRSKADSSKFGFFAPYSNLMSQVFTMRPVDNENDSYLLALEELRDEFLAQEKDFYSKLGVKDFEEFKNIWHFSTDKSNIQDLMRNEVLELFIGEMVRLVTNADRTDIEKLFGLAAMELDKYGFEGIENDNIKKAIKDRLVQDGLLEVLTNSAGQYVPAEGKSRTFFDDLSNWIQDQLEQDIGTKAQQAALPEIEKVLNQLKIGNGDNMAKRVAMTDKRIKNKISPSRVFVTWKIDEKLPKQKQLNRMIDLIISFIGKAALVKFDSTTYENFLKYWQKPEIENFKVMLRDFFSTTDSYNKYLKGATKGAVDNKDIQGLFGEISNYGHLYYNLGRIQQYANNVSLINLGTVLNLRGKESAVDIAINIDGKKFGFQAKNPYRTDKGSGNYKTYDNETFKLNENNLYNYLDMEADEREIFEMINLNYNNYPRPQEILKLINQLLLMNNSKFLRMNAEQYKKDEDNKELLKDFDNTRNVFYVLKGELIPSSKILDGLIQQYKILLGIEQEQTERNIMKINYTNNIAKKVVEPKDKDSKIQERFNRDYVVEGAAAKNLLSQAQINTALVLNIPSIKKLTEKG